MVRKTLIARFPPRSLWDAADPRKGSGGRCLNLKACFAMTIVRYGQRENVSFYQSKILEGFFCRTNCLVSRLTIRCAHGFLQVRYEPMQFAFLFENLFRDYVPYNISLRRAVAFTLQEMIGLDAPHIALKDAGATYEMKRTDSGTGEPRHSWLAVSREQGGS